MKLQAAGVPAIELRIPRTDHAFDLFFPQISPAAQTAMYDVDRLLALMASPVDWKTASLPAAECLARTEPGQPALVGTSTLSGAS